MSLILKRNSTLDGLLFGSNKPRSRVFVAVVGLEISWGRERVTLATQRQTHMFTALREEMATRQEEEGVDMPMGLSQEEAAYGLPRDLVTGVAGRSFYPQRQSDPTL